MNTASHRTSVNKWHKAHPKRVRELKKASYARIRDRNPELARQKNHEHRLWTCYRMTLETEQRMLEEQEHRCKICKRHESIAGPLQPDHNHKTKKVRGLLCCMCNRALGQVRESIEVLESMIVYLKEDI